MSTKDRKLFILKQTKNCQPVRTSSKTNEIQNFFDQENTKLVHIKIQLLLFQE